MPHASRDTWSRNKIYDAEQHEGHDCQVCSVFIIHCLVTDKWKLLNGLLKEGGLSKVFGICQVQELRPALHTEQLFTIITGVLLCS